MDNTGFIQNENYCKVILSKVSSNMWSNYAEGFFRINFVVCVSAMGTVATPLLIFPGKCLNRNFLEECDI